MNENQLEYEVTVLFDASSRVTVMAESPEDAADKAEYLTSGNQHLCLQCSNTLETGDAIGCLVYKGDELVAETDWKSQRITGLETANAQLRAELEAVRRAARRVCDLDPHESSTTEWNAALMELDTAQAERAEGGV